VVSATLGRTNKEFPPFWLKLALPKHSEDLDAFIEAVSDADLPVDVTSQPGLWGGKLRGDGHFRTYTSSSHFEHATDSSHAANLVQADLIQTLSAIGHETIDIYFLRIRRAVEEFQINGVLEALESAKQEGHIRFIGLASEGNPFGALSMWQFHDAFDVLQVARNPIEKDAYETLSPLARQRRVGIVTTNTLDWLGEDPLENSPIAQSYLRQNMALHPVWVTVKSFEDVERVQQARTDVSLSPSDQDALDLAIGQSGGTI